jgi:hypothetical protein
VRTGEAAVVLDAIAAAGEAGIDPAWLHGTARK